MARAEQSPLDRLGSAELSPTQLRIIGAALGLFEEHGVSGTSLQMIATAVGVTKAAIYHQFKTKEAIVVAAVDSELGRLEEPLEAAEAAGGGPGTLATLLTSVIDLAVGHRRMVSTLLHDPVIARLLSEHPPFQRFMERLYIALLAGGTDARARLRVAMITSAIGGAVTHPLVADLDDDTLRQELFGLTTALLDVELGSPTGGGRAGAPLARPPSP